MIKELELENGTKVALKSSAALMYLYRDLFGRDILKDFNEIIKSTKKSKESVMEDNSIRVLTDVAYTMAKLADKTIPEPVDWLDQFDLLEFYQKVLPLVSEMWSAENRTNSAPKNV